MGRFAGRNMLVYVAPTAAGAATPLPFMADYSIDSLTDQIEVTAGGDVNKTYVTGLPDFKGSISGFFEQTSTATSDALWACSRDGLARKFYLYPDSNVMTSYFYGTAFFDFTLKASVGSAVAVSSKIAAAGAVLRTP